MMNVTQLIFVFIGALSTIGGVLSRALPTEDDFENSLSRNKRQVADVIHQENASKYKKKHFRRLIVARLVEALDTSGSKMQPFPGGDVAATTFTPVETSSDIVPATSTTPLETSGSRGRGSGEPNKRRGRKQRRRNRKHNKRKRRNRKMGKNRRGGRDRRDLDEIIATLLQSQDGEQIINAVAAVVAPGQAADVEAAKKIIRKTANKCECKFASEQENV